MKLKIFHAPTIDDALSDIRSELGDNAIIVSTYQSRRGQGAQVTTALEEFNPDDVLRSTILKDKEDNQKYSMTKKQISSCLEFHGINRNIINTIIKTSDSISESDTQLILAGVLDVILKFGKIVPKLGKPIIAVGPPGNGKTTTVARLAARSVLLGKKVKVITTDTIKSGAFEQLDAFTELLDLKLDRAPTPEKLRDIALKNSDAVIFVDSPAINYMNIKEINDLKLFVKSINSSPLLVLSSTIYPAEAYEIATTLNELGTKDLHFTHIDCCRRFGTIIESSFNTKMKICEISKSPFITNGLSQINPMSLARLLTHETNDKNQISLERVQ
tara:strand:+ start:2490 stop:3479 length:990 start_codon:yes stop_codon:yes gene_type:complete